MEDKPTVQMDSFPPDGGQMRADEVKTPSTIPIDDMLKQQDWSAPPSPVPSPAIQQPVTPPPEELRQRRANAD